MGSAALRPCGVPVRALTGTILRSARLALRVLPLLAVVAAVVGAESAPKGLFSAQQRAYWALQPVERPSPPAISNPAWVRNPVDAFVLARLSHERLEPSPQAGRVTLIRRVSFDLTGLPPSPSEVSAFVADKSPGAYEELV